MAHPDTTASADHVDPLKCVEHGVWTPIPQPPPAGDLLLKLKDVDAKESAAVKERGVLSFHMAGCTGHFGHPVPQGQVASAMAKQVDKPNRWGGYSRAAAASFFYHLGDIVYKDDDRADPKRADQQLLYDEHFYRAYADYPRNIFAVAGNHDGKDSAHPEKSAVRHFLKNFCADKRRPSSDDARHARQTMIQPYLYWVLRTPLAHIVGLYSNDVNGGQLDDPQGSARPQYEWLVRTLQQIRKEDDGRALLLAVHYPPYSGAANFVERGDPNLAP